MARVHFVKKARFNNPAVKAGEPYWWWAFMVGGRGGPRHYSATRPRASQTTSSEFLSQAYAIGESIHDMEATTPRDAKEQAEQFAEDIRALGDEQQEKLDNMPEGLQQGGTGQLLEQRCEACEDWATALETAEYDDSEWDEADEEQQAECLAVLVADIQSHADYEGE